MLSRVQVFIPKRFGFYLDMTYQAPECACGGVGKMRMSDASTGTLITEQRADVGHIARCMTQDGRSSKLLHDRILLEVLSTLDFLSNHYEQLDMICRH